MTGPRSVLCMRSCMPRLLLRLRLPSLLFLILNALFFRRDHHHHRHRSARRPCLRVAHLRHRGTANPFLLDSLPFLPRRGRRTLHAPPTTAEGVSHHDDGDAIRLRIDLRTTRRDDPIGGALHHEDGASRLRTDPRIRGDSLVGACLPRRGRRREDRRCLNRRGRNRSLGCSW